VTQYRRTPRPLSNVLGPLQGRLAPDTLLAQVQRAWREAVGETIAAQAQPVAERGGVLTVSCEASVWAQELDLMGPELVERLNSSLTNGSLTRLKCVATPPRGA
jgi:predicted nucleic acid-binding Zn ribbon protein